MAQTTIENLEKVGDYLDQDSKVFLVTGGKSFESSGAKGMLEPVIAAHQVTQFNDFSPNPKLEEVVTGIGQYRDSGADTVMAVGGGSAIDVAKSILILSSQSSDDYERMVRDDSAKEPLKAKFIAVPTTAGTGSEATHFAVVYVDGTKTSLSHPDAVAGVAVLDARLTAGLPPAITAATGMDAIAQATEAYWSVNSTDESRRYSAEALRLLLPAIVPAVKTGHHESRSHMLYGANLAGKAINIAKTTACHAISYPITSRFNVPHGHAVGLTLPSFMEFNDQISEADVQDRRGHEFVKTIMAELFKLYQVGSAVDAKQKLEGLMDTIGLERSLAKLGIDSDGVEYIADNGFNPQRVKNNPRVLTRDQLVEILSSL